MIKIRIDGSCGTITLNRPDCHNALSHAMVGELTTAMSDLLQERRVHSIILTGAGNSFSSGTDLRELKASYESQNAFLDWHDQVTRLKELIEMMLRYPKPIIAAVHGQTLGTGATLMLAADLVIAGQSAQIGFPEATMGLNAGLAIPLLAHRIGNSVATRMLLTGRQYSAAECLDLGLVAQVVPDDLLWVQAMELGKKCSLGARESHQMTKRMLNESIGENLFTLLSLGAADMASARTTDIAQEGINAFLEKRPPKWD